MLPLLLSVLPLFVVIECTFVLGFVIVLLVLCMLLSVRSRFEPSVYPHLLTKSKINVKPSLFCLYRLRTWYIGEGIKL